MMLTLILLVISVLLIFVIISLEGKLKDGRRRIADGERQVEAAGINQLNAGKSKLALGETVKVILIILCTVCVIWAIIRIVKSVMA